MSELEWLSVFGDNLIDILREHGLSQKELADKCGISEAAISSYINKKKMPSIKTIVNMCYALDINPQDLIDFGDKII